MTWFTENPTPPVVLGTIIAAVFAVVLAKTGKREALYGIVVTAAATIGIVVMNILIVTPREEVTAALDEMRVLVEVGDRPELLKRIDPSAVTLRNNINLELAYLTVSSAKISDLEVIVAPSNVAAKAKFRGVVDFKDTAGRLPTTHFPLKFEVDLQKVDGVWIVMQAKWVLDLPGGKNFDSYSAPVAQVGRERIG